MAGMVNFYLSDRAWEGLAEIAREQKISHRSREKLLENLRFLPLDFEDARPAFLRYRSTLDGRPYWVAARGDKHKHTVRYMSPDARQFIRQLAKRFNITSPYRLSNYESPSTVVEAIGLGFLKIVTKPIDNAEAV